MGDSLITTQQRHLVLVWFSSLLGLQTCRVVIMAALMWVCSHRDVWVSKAEVCARWLRKSLYLTLSMRDSDDGDVVMGSSRKHASVCVCVRCEVVYSHAGWKVQYLSRLKHTRASACCYVRKPINDRLTSASCTCYFNRLKFILFRSQLMMKARVALNRVHTSTKAAQTKTWFVSFWTMKTTVVKMTSSESPTTNDFNWTWAF